MTAMVLGSFWFGFVVATKSPAGMARLSSSVMDLQPDYFCIGCVDLCGSSRTNAVSLSAGSAMRSNPLRTSNDASRVIGMRRAFAAW
jgi:hypothetical protein